MNCQTKTSVTLITRLLNYTRLTTTENKRNQPVMTGRPVLSPLAWVLAYDYRVHQISPANQPQGPDGQSTFLVVYRKRDDQVGFMEINAVTARLLELLQDDANSATGKELLLQIAGEIDHPKPQVVSDGGKDILADLHSKDIILGTKT